MTTTTANVQIPSQNEYVKKGTKTYTHVSLAFLAAGIATFAILYSVQPVFPVLTNSFHISPAESSLSLSVSTALLAITLPIAAVVSDAIGRKKLMVGSLVISAMCCLLTAFAPNFTTLLVLRTLQGIVLSGVPAVAMAYLSEEVEAQSLGFAMGMYISGSSIGGLMGRLLVSFVTDVSSWRVAIAVTAGLSLLMSFFFWRMLPPSRHFNPHRVAIDHFFQSFGKQLRDPGLICLYLMGALLMGGFVTLYNYMGFRLLAPPYGLSQSVAGLIFIVYLAGTFSSSWMGRIADKIGRRKVLWLNVVLMALGAGITLMSSLPIIIIGTAVFTFGFFGAHSTASSWVGRRAQEGKAQASSLYLLFYYVGSSIGGSLGGVFWSNSGWSGTISMILVLLLAAFVISLIMSFIRPVQPQYSAR